MNMKDDCLRNHAKEISGVRIVRWLIKLFDQPDFIFFKIISNEAGIPS